MNHVTQKSMVAACVLGCLIGISVSAKTGHSRNWTVPGTQLAPDIDVQSAGAEQDVIPCHVVGFRSKYSEFDKWGNLTLYPVVKAPNGIVYRGFVRTYPAGTFGDRWAAWTFPVEFRDPTSQVKNWNDASEIDIAGAIDMPAGNYQVKWVVNDRLFDIGSTFSIPPKDVIHYRKY